MAANKPNDVRAWEPRVSVCSAFGPGDDPSHRPSLGLTLELASPFPLLGIQHNLHLILRPTPSFAPMSGKTSDRFTFYPSQFCTSTIANASYPPFTSGTWTWTHSPSTNRTTISCKSVNAAVHASSVLLTIEPQNGYGLRQQVDNGISNGRFPPSPDWSLSCLVTRTRWGGS